jgi:hypothetical protein
LYTVGRIRLSYVGNPVRQEARNVGEVPSPVITISYDALTVSDNTGARLAVSDGIHHKASA